MSNELTKDDCVIDSFFGNPHPYNFCIKNASNVMYNPSRAELFGLEWVDVGSNAPDGGQELTNANLSSALQNKKIFTRTELQDYGVNQQLQPTDYIKSGDSYFQPAPECELWGTDCIGDNMAGFGKYTGALFGNPSQILDTGFPNSFSK